MAATIAIAAGYDKSGRVKETHRLGSCASKAEANTWRTFATAYVHASGAGFISVSRDGKMLSHVNFGPETEES